MPHSSGDMCHIGDPVWWVLERSHTKGSARLVLLVLAESADYRKCIVSVSIERLMKLVRLSRRRVFAVLDALRDQSEISRDGLGFDRRSGAAIYHLSNFCETGSCEGVLWTALSCPHVVAIQRSAKGVSQTAYVNQKERRAAPKVPGTTLGIEWRRPNGNSKGIAARPTGAVPAPPGKYDLVKAVIVKT